MFHAELSVMHIPCFCIGEPPVAKVAKDEHEWRRNEVEGTIRQWFRFMVLKDQTHGQQVRKEWQKVFDELPPNNDQSQLPLEKRPKWRELPKRCNLRDAPTGASHSRDLGGSSALENPPINPVTGYGRTQTEVEREVRAYRAALRRSSVAAKNPPVFQGDYLFVQLPSKPVFLARVVHDCCLDDAISPSLTFTVCEYAHTPQQGMTGFFGTFTKKVNESWDPLDKRKGGKFVRIQNITRNDIVAYDVMTKVDRQLLAERAADELPPQDCLRVKPSSLRALASKVPELAFPAEIPRSHAALEQEEANARRVQEQRARDGDDPPAPIPPGFELVTPLSDGQQIKHFMIWTRLDGGQVKWHQGKVVKLLPPNQRQGYTHDATFVESPGVRGVRLTKEAYDDGCWVVLKELERAPPRSQVTQNSRARASAGPTTQSRTLRKRATRSSTSA